MQKQSNEDAKLNTTLTESEERYKKYRTDHPNLLKPEPNIPDVRNVINDGNINRNMVTNDEQDLVNNLIPKQESSGLLEQLNHLNDQGKQNKNNEAKNKDFE